LRVGKDPENPIVGATLQKVPTREIALGKGTRISGPDVAGTEEPPNVSNTELQGLRTFHGG
jgi:hypothetical protein